MHNCPFSQFFSSLPGSKWYNSPLLYRFD
jgi:hypothetical protein